MASSGIYVHIPFCVKKCFYCDFFSVACDDAKIRKEYTRALLKEIMFYGIKYGKNFKADTVFFGGGTPSLMEPEFIEKILGALKNYFTVDDDCEITLECNPATLSMDKLNRYRSMGINRLSIGAQSFDDDVLQKLGRIHKSEDIFKTVNLARSAGFENISLDLMFAVPGQNKKIWKESVEKTLELRPEHISFYSLEIGENTVFGKMLKKGDFIETPIEEDRRMYAIGLDMIEKAGYKQYEISNASLRGMECRHNLKYWNLSEYLGLGAGAHSFIRDVRYSNILNVREYYNTMWSQDMTSMIRFESSSAFGANCVDSYNVNTYKDNVSEYAFTALRTTKGIVFDDFKRKFKNEFWDLYSSQRAEFEKFVKNGYAVYDMRHVALTRKGMNISNKIMALFV
ncbi:MAG: radical SAM family heme chaperone HemW [Firmicutes bacterium]|jgi:oxygen-independent coproporphyrinogen-3 oxidase|nr:radical SAM family heme chaperone HemW [Bacillota bacterium]